MFGRIRFNMAGEQSPEYVNPSIGIIGQMYFDERNNRIKFFSEEIHSTRAGIAQNVVNGYNMMFDKKATRLNARFFSQATNYGRYVEAKVPLSSNFSGIDLLFVGINEQVRMDKPEILFKEDELIEGIHSVAPHNRLVLPEGYSLERLDHSTIAKNDIFAMVELYQQAFPTYTTTLDDESVFNMVKNSKVYGVRHDDQIVSTSVGEVSSIKTSLGNFNICELSEMATRKDHRGKGLVTLATNALVEEIRPEMDLIYAESRSCHKAINQSFYNMGFTYAGRLIKQCILSGDHEVSENGPYENLNVWYLLPNKYGSDKSAQKV